MGLTHLYFVRHADSTYSPDERGRLLSEKGMKDAARVRELLKHEKISAVVSSPYKRAVQSVEGVADDTGVEVIIEENLRERLLSVEPLKDFPSSIKKVWVDWSFAFDGGESNVEAQKRGVASIHKLLEFYNGEKVVIGTHGNIMALIMNHFDANVGFDFWKRLDMPDIYKLSFDRQSYLGYERMWDMGCQAP